MSYPPPHDPPQPFGHPPPQHPQPPFGQQPPQQPFGHPPPKDPQPPFGYVLPEPPPHTPGHPMPLGQGMVPAKKRKLPVILGGVAVLLVLCCGGGIIAAANGDDEDRTVQQSQTATEPAETPAATQPTAKKTQPPAPEPTTVAPTTNAPKPEPVPYDKISDREWKKIAKDPDAHVGDTIVVYGHVTQFDAATGTDQFRADVGAGNAEYDWEYETNTILTGDTGALSELVEDDEFRANVVVTGSLSYDTQLGRSTTVPQLEVRSIKVL